MCLCMCVCVKRISSLDQGEGGRGREGRPIFDLMGNKRKNNIISLFLFLVQRCCLAVAM